jgi:hypothetical protein
MIDSHWLGARCYSSQACVRCTPSFMSFVNASVLFISFRFSCAAAGRPVSFGRLISIAFPFLTVRLHLVSKQCVSGSTVIQSCPYFTTQEFSLGQHTYTHSYDSYSVILCSSDRTYSEGFLPPSTNKSTFILPFCFRILYAERDNPHLSTRLNVCLRIKLTDGRDGNFSFALFSTTMCGATIGSHYKLKGNIGSFCFKSKE